MPPSAISTKNEESFRQKGSTSHDQRRRPCTQKYSIFSHRFEREMDSQLWWPLRGQESFLRRSLNTHDYGWRRIHPSCERRCSQEILRLNKQKNSSLS